METWARVPRLQCMLWTGTSTGGPERTVGLGLLGTRHTKPWEEEEPKPRDLSSFIHLSPSICPSTSFFTSPAFAKLPSVPSNIPSHFFFLLCFVQAWSCSGPLHLPSPTSGLGLSLGAHGACPQEMHHQNVLRGRKTDIGRKR